MKVLLLPFNIASKGAMTLDALNKISGIQARGIFVDDNEKVARSVYAKHFSSYSLNSNPVKWAGTFFVKSFWFAKLIRWADVVHWIWDSAYSSRWDLQYAKILHKPGLIEWSGSDIRYPERNFEINPYAHLLYESEYEYRSIEKQDISLERQKRFARLGYTPLVTPEMDLYVNRELFPKRFTTLHRLNVNDFKVTFSHKRKPLIVHAPSKRNTKGTKYILKAIDVLKEKYEFDFKLIENVPRATVLKIMEECDIYIDQLLLGTYGLASCEAMSMGKPVLAFIMNAVYENGLPADCPILNTSPDTIKDNLEILLADPSLRLELGKKGREFAVKYLDADKKALELVGYYKEVLKFN